MKLFISLATLLCLSLIRYSSSTTFDISFYYPLSLGSDNLLKQGVTKSRIQCHLDCLRTVECDTIAHRHRSACLLYGKEVLIPGTGDSVADYTHSRTGNKFAVYSKSKPRCTDWQTHTNQLAIAIQRLCVNLAEYRDLCNPFCYQIWTYAAWNIYRAYTYSKQICESQNMRLPQNLEIIRTPQVRKIFERERFFVDFKRVAGKYKFETPDGSGQELWESSKYWYGDEPQWENGGNCVIAGYKGLYNTECSNQKKVVCEKLSLAPVEIH